MKILVACEESQTVCKAFRILGHEAYSADILDCSGGHPEWHIKGDVLPLLNDPWDMVIAFPPCTHLAVSGAKWFEQKRKDGRQQQGIDFFMAFVNCPAPRLAIENPVGIMSKLYRKPDQIVHPYHFGEPHTKSTCLWLRFLPPLQPTKLLPPGPRHVTKSGKSLPEWYNLPPGPERARIRAKTFTGLAAAMATQWGGEPWAPVKFAHECTTCPCCEEPYCEECDMHYAECQHPGPMQEDEYQYVDIYGQMFAKPINP